MEGASRGIKEPGEAQGPSLGDSPGHALLAAWPVSDWAEQQTTVTSALRMKQTPGSGAGEAETALVADEPLL